MTIQKRTIKQRKELAQMIGRRVRRRRQQLGWRQTDLAAQTGLSSNVIHRIETGATLPSLETAYRLAASLNVPLSQLVAEDEDAQT
jgi:transcriptional regulator with XRE-family HTH domain